ncbi:ATP-binding protein [Leptospirillum ferriphilum]|uniref:ATP-binding protein n=1 Tax=Leptospirillum ferriphilum TaxID=178606 RepID=UPI003EE6CBCF
MLTSDQLNSLLVVNESDRLEFTTATDNTDKFSQAVCAFANDFSNSRKPGFLLIGVDGKGRPSGMKVTDKLLQNLGALRSDGNILPLPSMEVYSVGLEGGDIAVVEVHPSDLPPVRYKGQVWIRVGPRKAIASDHEERILTEKRIARVTSFDVSPVRGASLADLSLPIFHEYRQSVIDKDILERNHRTIEEQLAGLRFFDLALNVPTIAGILLFGKNPRYFLSGNYIQYLRLPGKVLTEVPVDQTEISGNLLTVLRELDLRLKAGIRTWLRFISPLREKRIFNYPEVAVREILLNAVLHRDYQSHTPVRFYWFSDRIEIQSPGGLYGEVTKDSLTRRNSYRNPVIAEAMKSLGYVNRFGYGIQRAQAALTENESPPLDFTIDERTFLVVIRERQG